MGRKSTKRKSEKTLPSPRMKHQKTAASTRRDRSNSADIEEESSVQREQNWIATPTDAKTRNKPRQSDNVWVPGVDEYDEDVGRTESQKFLALVEFESNKKKRASKEAAEYMEIFAGEVKSKERALKKHLYDLRIASSTKDIDFLESFKASYKSASPLDDPEAGAAPQNDTQSNLSFALVYGRSQMLPVIALQLVSEFDRAAKYVSGFCTPTAIESEWRDEDKNIERLLSIGKTVGLNNCKAILMASKAPPMGLEEVHAANIVCDGLDGNVSGGWGKVARRQEKAAQRLLKTCSLELA